VEFHQIDVEMVHASREEAMALAEGLLRHVIRTIVDQAADRLAELRREVALLRGYLDRPFELATHRRVVADLHSIGHPQQNDVEIDWPGEELISSKASGPFFIVDYPLGSRGFYDRESREQPGVLRNFDLIAPEGFGELASGGEREYEYDRIVEGMRRTGEDPEQFRWYLEFVEAGCPPSAGFGLGLERLMRFLTGLDEIWRVTAFPRVPGRVGL
jgi:asparaginyl-tRNA synthetase